MFKKIMMISLLIPVYDLASPPWGVVSEGPGRNYRELKLREARSERDSACCCGVCGCLCGWAILISLLCNPLESGVCDTKFDCPASDARKGMAAIGGIVLLKSLEAFAHVGSYDDKMNRLKME